VVERVKGQEVARPYSIASPPDGNVFALCLNRVDDDFLSPYLFDLKPGEEVEIGQPVGEFTMRATMAHPSRRAVLVAAGTGIAPFRSMLLAYLPHTPLEITLLFGARYERDLLYRDEFEKLGERYQSFRFLPTITRPSESWRGRIGRVQAHVDDALAIRTPEESSQVDVYICGLTEMVDDMRKELQKRGLDRKQIIYEKYD
jgi:NAD(P)H-flavin reductase